jgi:uncharacterized membrane protein
MTSLLNMIAVDFTWLHASAVTLIFLLWAGYSPTLRLLGRGSLNEQLHIVRRRWFHVHGGISREHRVFDAIMLGHINSSISYFGSATLLVLAGLVGSFFNINDIYMAAVQLKFVADVTLNLFTLQFAVVTLILALSFFSFTYAMRQMAYTFALLGGLQEAPGSTTQQEVMAEQAATVLTEAVRSINSGVRGFYYAIAGLFLFVGPLGCIAATLAVTALLYYRQLSSPTAVAIGRYVEALKKSDEISE